MNCKRKLKGRSADTEVELYGGKRKGRDVKHKGMKLGISIAS